MEELREWRCERGHILGYVHENGKGIHVLLLLRQALAEAEEGELDMAATVTGLADVRCSICWAMRTWFPDAKAMKRIRELTESKR